MHAKFACHSADVVSSSHIGKISLYSFSRSAQTCILAIDDIIKQFHLPFASCLLLSYPLFSLQVPVMSLYGYG